MLITFFYIKGTDDFEFIPQNQTVNRAYYVKIMKQLHEAECRQRPELRPNNWIFRHKNDSRHKTLSVKQFLAQKSINEMEQPPFSPDLAPNDLWLFPKIKSALKGRIFQNTEDIKKKCEVCDDGTENYSTTQVPKIFATVTATLG
jgi:transposase